jgi:hypothetical protein
MGMAAQLEVDQKALQWRRNQGRNGARFVGYDDPAPDSRSFPCSRCACALTQGAVSGVFWVVSQTFASWNRIAIWFRKIEGLRRAV